MCVCVCVSVCVCVCVLACEAEQMRADGIVNPESVLMKRRADGEGVTSRCLASMSFHKTHMIAFQGVGSSTARYNVCSHVRVTYVLCV